MPGPRERVIDVGAHMNDPSLDKTRKQLSELVRQSHQEIDAGREDLEARQEDEEESYLPQPQSLQNSRSRGPIANRVNEKRMQEARDMPLPVPPRLQHKMNDPEIRRVFDPNQVLEDSDNTGPISNNRPKRETISNHKYSIGNGGTEPQAAPQISEIQRLEKKLQDQQKEISTLKEGRITSGDATPVDNPKAPGRLAARRKEYNAKYQKIMPPSKCIFYTNFKPEDLQLKLIDVPTQKMITKAKIINDISMFIDAIGSTLKVGVDIRDLTLEDWFYVLYWHKYNSYNRTPLILSWTSKYGNKNQYVIQQTDIKYINPQITAEQYKSKYLDQGLCVPTLREWELLNTPNDLNEEDIEVVLRAQYYVGDTIEEKVDNYFANGDTVDSLQIIEEMKSEVVHGVVNTVDVVDAKFNPLIYVEQRRKYCESMKAEADQYKDSPALYYVYKEQADEIEAEVTILEETLKNGGQVRAEVETQPVRFNALDIFPFL